MGKLTHVRKAVFVRFRGDTFRVSAGPFQIWSQSFLKLFLGDFS